MIIVRAAAAEGGGGGERQCVDVEPISIARIEATLFGGGLALGDYFIVGGVPMARGESGGVKHPLLLSIDDAALRRACVDYLPARGAKEYAYAREVPPPASGS